MQVFFARKQLNEHTKDDSAVDTNVLAPSMMVGLQPAVIINNEDIDIYIHMGGFVEHAGDRDAICFERRRRRGGRKQWINSMERLART